MNNRMDQFLPTPATRIRALHMKNFISHSKIRNFPLIALLVILEYNFINFYHDGKQIKERENATNSKALEFSHLFQVENIPEIL